MTDLKQKLHELVNDLPDEELYPAERYLTFLRDHGDALLRKLMEAEPDDEPETEDEKAAVAQARQEFANGEVHGLDEVKRDLGL